MAPSVMRARRSRPRSPFLALGMLVALGAVARAQSRDRAHVESLVGALPQLARSTDELAGLERAVRALARDPEITVTVLSGATRTLRIAFAIPLPAARVAALLHVEHPYAISGDVHQHEWFLVSRIGVLEGPGTTRLSTVAPAAGHWVLHVDLAGRPMGPLPSEIAGASPAYDLRHYTASVPSLEITAAP